MEASSKHTEVRQDQVIDASVFASPSASVALVARRCKAQPRGHCVNTQVITYGRKLCRPCPLEGIDGGSSRSHAPVEAGKKAAPLNELTTAFFYCLSAGR